MDLRIVLEEDVDGQGFTVTVPSLPGCISEGRNHDEAMRNIMEAIQLYLDPVDDDMARFGPRSTVAMIAV